MKSPSQHASERHVAMSQYVVDDKACALTTDSLGPCIAIGVRHGQWLALIHQFGPSGGMPEFEFFLKKIADLIPAHARAGIRPIVAGGKLAVEDDDEDQCENAGTLEDRAWVLAELEQLGFGVPHLHWGVTDSEGQSVRLDKATSTAVVSTEGLGGSLTVEIPLPPA